MTYTEGLGASNIVLPGGMYAITPFGARIPLTQPVTTAPRPAPAPAPTYTPPPIIRPVAPTMTTRPVLTTTTAQPPVTLRPVLPAPTPVGGQPTGSAGVMPVIKLPPQSSLVATARDSFIKSPVVLVGLGLAALLLLNRDKRRH